LLLLLCAGCGVELEHGLDERQANQVAALLEGAGLSADKVTEEGATDRYKIVVSRGDAARAFALLESQDLPRPPQKTLGETFSAGALLPSAVEERARFSAALSAELERTLEGLPEVARAYVHLALPPEDPLAAGPRLRPTASVLVKTRGRAGVGESEVRKLVAGAVHDLSPVDVSVVIAPLGAEPAAPALERLGPLQVAHGSRRTLATLAASGLALVLLLGIGLVLAATRISTLRRRLRDAQAPRT
jgi:type III secretion protein J